MTGIQEYMGIRKATKEEIKVYEWVELFLEDVSEENFSELLDLCWNNAMGKKGSSKKIKMKLEQVGIPSFIVTPQDLMTWYYID